MAVQVHELNADLLENSLSEKMSLNSGKSLIRVVIGLLN